MITMVRESGRHGVETVAESFTSRSVGHEGGAYETSKPTSSDLPHSTEPCLLIPSKQFQ